MQIPKEIAEEIQRVTVDEPTDRVDKLSRGGALGIDDAEAQKAAGVLRVPEGTPIRYGT